MKAATASAGRSMASIASITVHTVTWLGRSPYSPSSAPASASAASRDRAWAVISSCSSGCSVWWETGTPFPAISAISARAPCGFCALQ